MDGMNVSCCLHLFFRKSAQDPRIGKSHLAVYIALLQRWYEHEYRSPLRMFARDGARAARVSVATYHQCIIDLHQMGYLRYRPSFRSDIGSQIEFFR